MATTQWLQRDQTLPLSVKDVACETIRSLDRTVFSISMDLKETALYNMAEVVCLGRHLVIACVHHAGVHPLTAHQAPRVAR